MELLVLLLIMGAVVYGVMCFIIPEVYLERIVNLFYPSKHKIVEKWVEEGYLGPKYYWRCTCGKVDWGVDSSHGRCVHAEHRWMKRRQDRAGATTEEGRRNEW